MRTTGNRYNPYLDSTTAGYNMVDAVQAAHVRGASSRRRPGYLSGSERADKPLGPPDELADNYSYELELAGSG